MRPTITLSKLLRTPDTHNNFIHNTWSLQAFHSLCFLGSVQNVFYAQEALTYRHTILGNPTEIYKIRIPSTLDDSSVKDIQKVLVYE